MAPQSVMPAYPWLLERDIDYAQLQRSVNALNTVGVPYEDTIDKAQELGRLQAAAIAAQIVEQGGPAGLEGKEITALVAYMQRLGADITRRGPEAGGEPPPYLASAPNPRARPVDRRRSSWGRATPESFWGAGGTTSGWRRATRAPSTRCASTTARWTRPKWTGSTR